jgi:hypothetical protein
MVRDFWKLPGGTPSRVSFGAKIGWIGPAKGGRDLDKTAFDMVSCETGTPIGGGVSGKTCAVVEGFVDLAKVAMKVVRCVSVVGRGVKLGTSGLKTNVGSLLETVLTTDVVFTTGGVV